jgi:hypothetical protein
VQTVSRRCCRSLARCAVLQGNVLLAGSADKTVWMWLAATGKFMQVFVGHEAAVTCGAFSGDGKAVLTGSADSTARVWNPKDGVCMHVFKGHGFYVGAISAIVAHHERPLLLTAGQDGLACLANYRTGKVLAIFSHAAAKDETGGAKHGATAAAAAAAVVTDAGVAGGADVGASGGGELVARRGGGGGGGGGADDGESDGAGGGEAEEEGEGGLSVEG